MAIDISPKAAEPLRNGFANLRRQTRFPQRKGLGKGQHIFEPLGNIAPGFRLIAIVARPISEFAMCERREVINL
jgi:hypothetical protein